MPDTWYHLSYLVSAAGKVNFDPRYHGFGVPKEGVKAESKFFHVFSLYVAKFWLFRIIEIEKDKYNNVDAFLKLLPLFLDLIILNGTKI